VVKEVDQEEEVRREGWDHEEEVEEVDAHSLHRLLLSSSLKEALKNT